MSASHVDLINKIAKNKLRGYFLGNRASLLFNALKYPDVRFDFYSHGGMDFVVVKTQATTFQLWIRADSGRTFGFFQKELLFSDINLLCPQDEEEVRSLTRKVMKLERSSHSKSILVKNYTLSVPDSIRSQFFILETDIMDVAPSLEKKAEFLNQLDDLKNKQISQCSRAKQMHAFLCADHDRLGQFSSLQQSFFKTQFMTKILFYLLKNFCRYGILFVKKLKMILKNLLKIKKQNAVLCNNGKIKKL